MITAIENLRILVVEDEMLIAMMLEDMLGALGYAVVGPFANLDSALAAAASEALDAALLDVNLGGRTVYPVAEKLVERKLPFAFVTGYDSRGLTQPWLDWPRLDKPFRQTDLERTLRRLFGEP